MKKAVNISCAKRVKQYPNGSLHADNGHTRKGSIDRHLKTPTHAEKRRLQDESEERSVKKQATISGPIKRITEAFTAANIPLYKLDHPRLHEYLQKSIRNLGVLPTLHHLR